MTVHAVQREIWEFLSKFWAKYCILTMFRVLKGSQTFQIPLELEQIREYVEPHAQVKLIKLVS